MPWALPPRLPLEDVPLPSVIARIHWEGTVEPFFGPGPGEPPSHRFHDPLGEFRVCFLGENATASFTETFLRKSPVRLITRDELAERRLTTFRIRRPLRLSLVYGSGLARLGLTADITSSPPPYGGPQRLSRDIWAHSDRVDGITYRCRHDNDLRAVALYDRAADTLELLHTADLLADRARLLEWSRRYGFVIA